MIEETYNFDGWASPGNSADLLPYFDAWDDRIREFLERPHDWQKWTVMSMNPVPQWGEGPVTLIGEAAHPIEPFMAQGGSIAIEDAATLAAIAATDRKDIANAFRLYEATRQARTTRIQKASHQRGRIYHMSGPNALGAESNAAPEVSKIVSDALRLALSPGKVSLFVRARPGHRLDCQPVSVAIDSVAGVQCPASTMQFGCFRLRPIE